MDFQSRGRFRLLPALFQDVINRSFNIEIERFQVSQSGLLFDAENHLCSLHGLPLIVVQ
jgi:hypothetical protein